MCRRVDLLLRGVNKMRNRAGLGSIRKQCSEYLDQTRKSSYVTVVQEDQEQDEMKKRRNVAYRFALRNQRRSSVCATIARQKTRMTDAQFKYVEDLIEGRAMFQKNGCFFGKYKKNKKDEGPLG